MKNDNLYKDLENSMKKQMKNDVEKMLIRLIDKSYSKEINAAFPPSLGNFLLKYLSTLLFVFSIISYFLTHSFLIAILILLVGVFCYWLSGKIRGGEVLIAILSDKKNFTKFHDLYKKLYE